ncbi:hypothetical protein [Salarchaeum japonicum]|uniref:hypothetical protein n=1 Tax=Salarchaeum japonicum TaxID=555573 RepID=UPI003C731C41
MNRRAFVAGTVGGLAALAGCGSYTDPDTQPPRAYRLSFFFGHENLTTLSVDSSDILPSAQALVHGQDDARDVFRDIESFSRAYSRYVRMDYEDRFVGVTALKLPADRTVLGGGGRLDGRTYSVTVDLEPQEPVTSGPNWEYVFETWLLGETEPPRRTELQVTVNSGTRTTT